MCSLDITFQRDSHGVLGKSEGVSPDSGSGVVYTATTSASVWHRRLGHMNPRNMEVLRNKKGNGVEYTGTTSGCDICSVTKSKQQAHPKKSTRKTTRPMQLVYTDLMGPFTPAAKGGYRFVSKFTDDYSRMKEIFLLKNKTEAAESLHQYNMTVAAPLGLRIENLRCDKGGEYTGQEFRTLCVGAGINIEYTATNTPQQNGVSERDGQTLAKIIPMPYEGRRLSPVHVGRADVHGHKLSQQVPPFHSGRGHPILQNAQFGAGPHGLARHRRQSIRPP